MQDDLRELETSINNELAASELSEDKKYELRVRKKALERSKLNSQRAFTYRTVVAALIPDEWSHRIREEASLSMSNLQPRHQRYTPYEPRRPRLRRLRSTKAFLENEDLRDISSA